MKKLAAEISFWFRVGLLPDAGGTGRERVFTVSVSPLLTRGLVQLGLSGCARLFAEKFYFSDGRYPTIAEPATGDLLCQRRSFRRK